MPTLRDALVLSGDLFLPKAVRDVLEHYWIGSDRSLVYVTNWSLVHGLTGLVTGYLLMTYRPTWSYYWTGFWIHTVWEIWQLVVQNTPWTLRGAIDIGMDTVLFMGGLFFWAVIYR